MTLLEGESKGTVLEGVNSEVLRVKKAQLQRITTAVEPSSSLAQNF